MSVSASLQTDAAPSAGVIQTQALFGRFMLPDMSEHPCQVHSISIDGAKFLSSHVPPPGVAIVAYLEEVGRIEATSADPIEGGFAVTFSLTGARRDRLQSRLNWLQQKQSGGSEEDRRHTRFEPKESRSVITLPDGREYPCEVIDISLSGAAVKVEVIPAIGTHLLLGKMRGRVVRYLENGIAIEFVKQLDRQQLSEQVG